MANLAEPPDRPQAATAAAAALTEALALAADGVPVFPCRWDKTPATPHGFCDATADAARVRELWRLYGGALVGMATGAASGLDVLDIDPRHGGHLWLADNRERLPQTLTLATRGGGEHRYFGHASGLRCSTERIAPGVDVRADGGYAIVWPAAGLPVLCTAEITEWPPWLLQLARPALRDFDPCPSHRRVADTRSLMGLLRFVAGAAVGTRNVKLFWAGCRVAEMIGPTLSAAEAANILAEAATRAGLPRDEALRTARSGIARGHAGR